MAQDRGSLRYTIDLEAVGALKSLREFRDGLEQTRQAWRDFRSDIKQSRSSVTGITSDLKALAKATTESAKAAEKASIASRKRAAAAKEAAKQTGKDVAATTAQTRATKKLTLAEKDLKNTRLATRRLRNQSRNVALKTAKEELAVTRLQIKAEQRLRVIQRLAGQQRNIKTGELLSEQNKRLQLEAQNKLEQQQLILNDKQLLKTQAELSVTEQLIKAERALTKEKRLRQKGLLPSGLTADQAGLNAFNKQLDQLKIQEVQQRLQALNPEFRKLQERLGLIKKEAPEVRKRFQAFNSVLESTRNRANRISFTFRRLIGIFAAFTIIRNLTQGFRNLVTGAIRFNAAIEQSVLGVASLFTAVGDVRSATGRVVGETEKLALAQKESRRQINLLRKDALQTVATFAELRDTFQVAIAPGIDAGLGIDQIRKFSIQISQAAAAIGLQQNQLAEEIRSILAGTIQLRTTRIAAALGITNEDIRTAKELGVLAEFLQDRFEAFTIAGAEALGLFNAVLARLRDAFQELIRQGSTEFFREFTSLLEDVFDGLVSINEEGLTLDPDVLDVVRSFFKGLQQATAEARRLLNTLQLEDFRRAAASVGTTIAVSARTVGSLIEGFIAGAKTLSKLLKPISNLFSGILPERSFQGLTREMTELLTVVLGVTIALKSMLAILTLIIAPFSKIGKLAGTALLAFFKWADAMFLVRVFLDGIKLTIAGITAPMLAVVAAVGLFLFSLVQVGLELAGIELTFEEMASLIRTTLVGAVKLLGNAFLVLAQTIKVVFTAIVATVAFSIQSITRSIVKFVLRALSLIGFDVDTQMQRLNDAQEEAGKRYISIVEKATEGLTKAWEALIVSLEVSAGRVAVSLQESLGLISESAANLIRDALAGRERQAQEDADDAFSGLTGELLTAEDVAANFVDELDRLPGILSRSNRGVKGFSATMKGLTDEFRDAADDFRIATDTANLSGATADFRIELAEGSIQLAKEEAAIKAEILKTENALGQAKAQALVREKQISREFARSAGLIDDITDASIDQLDLTTDIAAGVARIGSLQATQKALRIQGREEEAALVEDRIKQEVRFVDSLKKDASALSNTLETMAFFLAEFEGTEAAQGALKLVQQQLLAFGQERASLEELLNLRKDQEKLEQAINDITAKRIQTIARQSEAQANERIALLEAELNAAVRLEQFSSSLRINAPGAELAQARGALEIELARLDALRQRAIAQKAANDDTLQKAASITNSEEIILDLILAQEAAERQLNLEIAKQESLIRNAAQAADDARRRLEEPVSFGLEQAFTDFENQATNQFENFREIGIAALEGLSSTGSQILTDMLDPRKSIDSEAVETAFGELFLRIADQMFEKLIQQGLVRVIDAFASQTVETAGPVAAAGAVTTAATALQVPATTLATGAAALNTGSLALVEPANALALAVAAMPAAAIALSGAATVWAPVVVGLQAAASTLLAAAILLSASGIGFAGGGSIPGAAVPSSAHFSAGVRGYAFGGGIKGHARPASRPSGLDRRDTVPIWAQQGEFMMRLAAVRKYGSSVMQALNNGMVDPLALRALAVSRAPVVSPKAPGFAEGGLVSDKLDSANAIAQSASRASSDRGLFQRALLVPDEETMDRLLAQGADAQQRWIEENETDVKASLGLGG